jgi:hypothetical protein
LPTAVRNACITIMESYVFHIVVMCTIIANCAMLAATNPLYIDNAVGQALAVAEFVFLAVYLTEMAVKMMATGLFVTRNEQTAYFRSGWNVFDFLIVIISILAVIPSVGANLSGIRALRALRAFRIFYFFRQVRLQMRALGKVSHKMSGGVIFFFLFFF